jgi:hypothetical protein
MARTRGANALQVEADQRRDFAELDDVRDFAEQLPERFLYCREMGHNWRPYSAGRYRDGGFERTLRCSRCRTRRVQEISNRGVIVTNKYIHPEGYLHKGMGRIIGEGRGVLRLESIKRIVAKSD